MLKLKRQYFGLGIQIVLQFLYIGTSGEMAFKILSVI